MSVFGSYFGYTDINRLWLSLYLGKGGSTFPICPRSCVIVLALPSLVRPFILHAQAKSCSRNNQGATWSRTLNCCCCNCANCPRTELIKNNGPEYDKYAADAAYRYAYVWKMAISDKFQSLLADGTFALSGYQRAAKF